MNKKMILCSNMHNEESEIVEWMAMANKMPVDGVIIVDSGSTDSTVDIAVNNGAIVIHDDIIRREGYGPARNHLIGLSKKEFPDAEWMMFLDADERISRSDFHPLRVIRDYLKEEYNAVAFPRLDHHDREMRKTENNLYVNPDHQCRMVRIHSKARYVRKLHEQISNATIYSNIRNPVIHHFHRCAAPGKRDHVGKLCSKLHAEDTEYGHTYPKHKKEDMYFKLYQKEGL